jgi:glutathione synthase/RimK-type ligase-like ATP-grasp enzyme
MHIILLGETDSERTHFFTKAADELGIEFTFLSFPHNNTFQDFNFSVLENCAIKIDPPDIHSIYIDELNSFSLQYSQFLKTLQIIPGVKFLNSPESISLTLDKLRCKNILLENEISTAPIIAGINSISELNEAMSARHLHSVFIKPRFGSGAAGIIAFRRNIKTGEELMYTTVQIVDGRLCNTRSQRCVRNTEEIEIIVNGILKLGAIVEKWIPKAVARGKAYDLRVVWQFGEMEHAVARLSKGVITNLHLGGEAINVNELNLSNQTRYLIEELCENAMCKFPELNSAGIDILLEQNTLKPYIIEINGQGDLLYKDIFDENKIYKNQLLYLDKNLTAAKKWF